MSKQTFLMSFVFAGVFTFASYIPVFADAVVKVSLLDKGGEMDLSKSMGLGMGMKADIKKAIMSIVADQKSVPAGKVTFEVTNASKGTVHEMLVAPVVYENTVLPFLDNENRADEEKSGDLGEVSELEPGKTGSLTVEMKPGLYILYCNVPGHYMAGMWTTLKVE